MLKNELDMELSAFVSRGWRIELKFGGGRFTAIAKDETATMFRAGDTPLSALEGLVSGEKVKPCGGQSHSSS